MVRTTHLVLVAHGADCDNSYLGRLCSEVHEKPRTLKTAWLDPNERFVWHSLQPASIIIFLPTERNQTINTAWCSYQSESIRYCIRSANLATGDSFRRVRLSSAVERHREPSSEGAGE